jgi:hypothetical protein
MVDEVAVRIEARARGRSYLRKNGPKVRMDGGC